MKEQVKITFLVDEETLRKAAEDAAEQHPDPISSIAIVLTSGLLAKNNEEFNTIDMAEVKNDTLRMSLAILAAFAKEEIIKSKGKGYLESIFRKDEQK